MNRFTKIKNTVQKYITSSWMDVNRPNKLDQAPTKLDDALQPDRYIMPFQMQRIKQDPDSWRDAGSEAENAWWMHRVKMQQLFIDTKLNGHVLACMNKAKDLVLLKKFEIIVGDVVDEDATKLLETKWFYDLMNYVLDARFYGYSLIGLGDIVNNEFPKLKLVRRWNVSPDRLNLTSIVYSLNGINFTDPSVKDPNGNSWYDWSIWVSTPNETGPSRCGYGLLYEVALYEIHLRHLLGFNSDYCEMFAQPFRHLKTDSVGEERDKEEEALQNMGSSPYLMTSKDAELDIKDVGKSGEGYKSYDNFENRLERKATKIILGHADAMDSVPGKLGGEQGDDNPIKKALDAVETKQCRIFEHEVNSQIIPKLINLGFPIKPGSRFRFKNDAEVNEIKEATNKNLLAVAMICKTFSEAGVKPPLDWITKTTGIKMEAIELPEPPTENDNKETQTKIKNFYAKASH